jgi:putative transposase
VRKYRLGAHTKSDLKVHLVWLPKYRKPVLTGEVAVRVRDLIRQVAAEHELEIISGKVARDHVHVFVGYRPNQDVSQIMQWLKGISSRVLLQEFPHLRKRFWGRHFWARGFWRSVQEISQTRWSRNTSKNRKVNRSLTIVDFQIDSL